MSSKEIPLFSDKAIAVRISVISGSISDTAGR